jgi:adenylate cyclase
MPPEAAERRLAAILSADVVGYSRLMAEDEAGTVRTLNAYRDQVGALVGEHRGRVVDFAGDNFLAEFPTATDAVEAAAEIQRVIKARNAAVPEGRAMEFRIGIHLGEVRVEGERIYGDGVNIAARLEGLAEPGGTCISGTVLEQIRRRLELDFDDLGEQTVKNIPDPVHAYRLHETPKAAAQEAPPRPFPRVAVASVLAVAAVLLVVVAYSWTRTHTSSPIRSLAVLPLENLSDDPDQEYFADGMTEALIGDLARIGSLRVISRTSVMKYKGERKAIPEIAQELDVDGVVEGTVARAGGRVRITAQLIDARDDRHLWSDRYDREFADVLALQSEVARAIAGEVRITLSPKEETHLASARPINPDAHEAYLKGRAHWMKGSLADHELALGYFQHAIRTDPGYAPGYAGLADVYGFLGLNGVAPPAELLPKAEAAALKALELDETLPEAHLSLGVSRMWHDWDFPAAEREFRRALELNPSQAQGHMWLGLYLSIAGRNEEALEEGNLAIKYDPLSAIYRVMVARLHREARDYDAAEGLLREALALDPTSAFAHSSLGYVYSLSSRHEEAIAEIEKMTAQGGPLWGLGFVYARAGREDEARAILEELNEREGYVPATGPALIYVGLGDHDKAFEWLERAYEERSVTLVFVDSPIWDPLRSDPRFQDLLRRIGLPES